MKKFNGKRLLAFVLAASMVFSLLPGHVHAAENENLALGKSVTVSSYDVYVGDNIVDGDRSAGSRWGTGRDAYENEYAEIDLGGAFSVKQIDIYFERSDADQNILSFKVEIYANGAYETVFTKDQRASHLESIVLETAKTAEKVKITVLNADGGTMNYANVGISEVEIYADTYVDPSTDNSRDIPVNVLTASAGDYETDGGEAEGPANLVLDSNESTLWHTDWTGTSRDNHWIQFMLGEDYVVDGLRYRPRQAGGNNGTITQYEVQVSDDGNEFRTVASGTWESNGNWKIASFTGVQTKYVRLVSKNAVTDQDYVFASAAEIRLTGEKPAAHEHSFVEQVATQDYQATEATCSTPATYYYSCECGENEEDAAHTFEGDTLPHNYGAPEFTWEGLTATATFTCQTDSSHTETVDATVTGEATEGDCETGATVVYTATVTMGGNTYTDTKEETTEGGGHNYVNGFCSACDDYEPAVLNENNVYEIENAGQLYWFADLVNKSGDAAVIDAVLTDDIVVNQAPLSETSRAWNPIGYYKTSTNKVYYSGTFDGQGHTVSGLYCVRPTNADTGDYIGMFGAVDRDGTVKNLGVLDSEFTGRNNVGGVAGYNYYGTVSGCWNTGKVTGATSGGVVGGNSGTVSRCYNTGAVSNSSISGKTGGVVGNNNQGTISDCFNTGAITGKNNVGGVAGMTNGGSVSNCYNTGVITNIGTSAIYVNSVIGWNFPATTVATVDNCYYLADSETDSLDGTIAKTEAQFASGEVTWLLNGGAEQENPVWKQTLEESSVPLFEGMKVHYNADAENPYYNTDEPAHEHTYGDPIFTWNGYESATATFTCTAGDDEQTLTASITSETTGGDCTTGATVVYTATVTFGEQTYTDTKTVTGQAGTHSYVNGFCSVCDAYEPAVLDEENNVYQISNAGQLYWFAKLVNDGEADADAILMQDITVNENILVDGALVSDTSALRAWTPIGGNGTSASVTGVKYSGTFDGNGKTVSGLYFNNNKAYFVGLIGYLNGGEVKNVGITDSYIAACQYFAAVVGKAENSAVLSCYNTGYIKAGIGSSGSSGKYSQYFGGVVGQAVGGSVISECYNAGTIHLLAYSKNAGGVVGNLTSTKDATVRTKIIDSYNTGDFICNANNTKVNEIGGVAGSTTYSDMERCWNEGDVKGTNGNVGGVVGKDNGSSNIRNCYNEGTVDCAKNYVGGVIGMANDNGLIENCYNVGAVTAESSVYVGSILGNPYDATKGNIVNCYYLTGSLAGSGNSTVDQEGLTAKTAEQFASGEVTYLLNGGKADISVVWKQTLTGEDAAATPRFTGLTVYHDDSADPAYFNLDETHEHVFDQQNTNEAYLATEATCEKAATYYLSCFCGTAHATDTFEYGEKKDHAYVNGFCSACDAYEPAVLNEDGVYEIGNGGQLYWFAAQVNDGDTDAKAILTNNIFVNENVQAEGDFRAWTPINGYTGTFDGDEHTISGLYFNDADAEYVGLFGKVGTAAVIQDVTLVDSAFTAKRYVGGIAGYAEGASITNCDNTASVNGGAYVGGVVGYVKNGMVTDCTNSGAITGTGAQVGGVVGAASGTSASVKATISGCTNTGAVSANKQIGGVVGYVSYGTVENCSNSANITGSGETGGVIGYVTGRNNTVRGCFNTGDISGAGQFVGGVAGRLNGATTDKLENCYNTGDVTNTAGLTGGVVGGYDNGSVQNCYNTGAVTGTGNYNGSIAGNVIGSAPAPVNCYYLADSETDSLNGTTAKTEAAFASGEVAYLLNGSKSGDTVIWKQTLTGENADATPNFDGAIVYMGYISCAEDAVPTYSNDPDASEEKPAHSGGEATCETGKICGVCGEEYTEALGHNYGEPVIVWNDDNTATATVTCANDETHVEELEVEVTSETTEGDCETAPVTTYTATVVYEEETYTSTKKVEGEAPGHAYGEPVIVWNDDNTATATVTCANDETHVEELEVKVTSETTEGDCETAPVTTYTATVLYKEKTYTSTKKVEGELGQCADEDKDHECDVCGENVGEHVAAEGSHDCDYCGEPVTECVDDNKDHKCDVCGDDMGEHKDANKDHKCDYGCSESIGVCEDKDNDGKCDYGCDKEFEVKPTEPDPTDPEPTEPDVTEPDPTEPDVTEPDPTDPEETEPKPTEPEPTEPDPTEPEAPKTEGVTRLAGADRLVTSYLVADQLKAKMGVEKFQNIIVASGATFADALPGSYLSAVKNAPILLTLAKDKYVNQTAEYIKANLVSGGTVYILGGESAVPKTMEAALNGINVKRVAGADRFGTNLAILKEAGVKAGDEILVCTAKEFADSLSASATGKPILLVYKKITDEQKTYLAALSNCKFTVVGGTTAVPDSIAKEMETYGAVTRLAGKDRLETSTMVAEKYFGEAKAAVVAYGWNFPDGLCGGSLAYAMDAPLILAHSKEKLAQFTADYTTKAGLTAGYVLGGEGLVDDAATRAIFGMGSEAITLIK